MNFHVDTQEILTVSPSRKVWVLPSRLEFVKKVSAPPKGKSNAHKKIFEGKAMINTENEQHEIKR